MSVFRHGLFKGKVALVTGGGTGIGKAITEELVTLGCKVVIASRKMDRLSKAVEELSPKESKVEAKVCNIRQENEVKNLISSIIKENGKLDFVVNNGGGQFLSSVSNMSTKGWNAVIDTNLNGTFHVCKEAYHQWMSSHGGAIVNITANMFRGMPMMAHSGAARAAVENLTKSLAVEWAQNGVRINIVAPGSIYSSTAKSHYGDHDLFGNSRPGIPAKRVGTPQEVSSAVCFLLSPGAAFISGATLRVDAGASLYSPQMYQIPEHKNLPAYEWKFKEDEEEKPKAKL
ncbi:peroxisomal trans-2-enoyl-CoA reductase-like [Oratosquilla oratoria]|uniref:peroxisomal trans-2-enoyl-CoA reductase-like n=1 Tax=Oratosquilla oratoria TaxID=337810 RepID=UPI003F76F891